MKEFVEKKGTHIVLKNEDTFNCLNVFENVVLCEILKKVSSYRELKGKNPFPEYYIVNVDEPYANLVLEVIKYGEKNK